MTKEERQIYNKNYREKNRKHIKKTKPIKPIVAASKSSKKKRSNKYYIVDDVLLYEMVVGQGKGIASDKLAEYWYLIIDKYCVTFDYGVNITNDVNYDLLNDARQYAIEVLLTTGLVNFDIERKALPYVTEIIKRAFWRSFSIWKCETQNNLKYNKKKISMTDIDNIF
jgi:hypothetical protein